MTRPRIKAVAAGVVLLAATALLGPRTRVAAPADDEPIPSLPPDLDAYLAKEEAGVPHLRAGSEKTIVWADSTTHAKTPLAVLYLHGFSADRREIDPVPRMVADSLGANLFYTRFTGHGRDAAAMGEASAGDWLRDVAEAMAVGDRLGDRVVLMGTSTGGTLALWAASRPAWRSRIAALVLVSPNLALKDPRARMLLWPWGGLLARMVVGGERCFQPANAEQAKHWTTCYPTRALLPMMAMVEHVRSRARGTVRAPLFIAYSPEDEVVDEMASRQVIERLAPGTKEYMVVSGSGNPDQHVITGDIMSPGTTDSVAGAAVAFLRKETEGGTR